MDQQSPGNLLIIWDYDGSTGNLNASYPYKFDERKLYREIENVDKILRLGKQHGIKMTFACVGFGAEPGVYPYHIQDQIKKIHKLGHEIASHSWRHEWFPYLEKKQIELSLARSKSALETCIHAPNSVSGFILPFSRPMSWYGRGAFSLGDRVFGPWYPGSSLGSILKFVNQAGYRWMRISYRPIWQRFIQTKDKPNLNRIWEHHRNVICVRNHVFGFDKVARTLLTQLSQDGGCLVVSAHPAALSFGRKESLVNFERFIEMAAQYQNKDLISSSTVIDHISQLKQ